MSSPSHSIMIIPGAAKGALFRARQIGRGATIVRPRYGVGFPSVANSGMNTLSTSQVSIWYGPTWSYNAGTGLLTNTPGTGGELLTNGTFDSDINGWSLTLGAGGGAIAWDAGTMKFTQGTSANMYASQQITSVANTWYVLQQTLTASDATLYHAMRLGTTQTGSQISLIPVAPGFNIGTWKLNGMATGTTLWATLHDASDNGKYSKRDNASLKALTLAHLFCGRSYTFNTNVTALTPVTITNSSISLGLCGGTFICLDNLANPQNCYTAYTDGVNAYLTKRVSGTVTLLKSGAIVYGAAKQVKIVKTATVVKLYYDNAQVGTDYTILAGDPSGYIHGFFSTDVGVTLDFANASFTGS